MKRAIKSATNYRMSKAVVAFEDQVGDLMYHADYSVECTGQFPNVSIKFTCEDSEPEMMPVITGTVNEYEEGKFEVIPTLTFPTLTVNEGDYYDAIHYWLEKWANVGRYITRLNDLSFDLRAELEDDDEE